MAPKVEAITMFAVVLLTIQPGESGVVVHGEFVGMRALA